MRVTHFIGKKVSKEPVRGVGFPKEEAWKSMHHGVFYELNVSPRDNILVEWVPHAHSILESRLDLRDSENFISTFSFSTEFLHLLEPVC